MRKLLLFVAFILSTSSIFCQGNNPEHYRKGGSSLGITCFPTVQFYYLDYGYVGYNIAPSYSYFMLKNFSVTGSFFYQINYAVLGGDGNSIVNMFHTSVALRYYFWKSRVFVEGSYNYGFSKITGSLDYFERINNPGIGFGMNGTFWGDLGVFTGKLSWEYSIKYRISTGYAPVSSYRSLSRFAIIYHF
ncbi:MAG: hypothetical protein PHR19_02015 [Bacteroidales bacterium]|jgi:hypothetical protein|nr:hypothetical protein [Bacteroidales bacterium]HHT51600.1 hypothetical protein [Bacteroidales bacterium]